MMNYHTVSLSCKFPHRTIPYHCLATAPLPGHCNSAVPASGTMCPHMFCLQRQTKYVVMHTCGVVLLLDSFHADEQLVCCSAIDFRKMARATTTGAAASHCVTPRGVRQFGGL